MAFIAGIGVKKSTTCSSGTSPIRRRVRPPSSSFLLLLAALLVRATSPAEGGPGGGAIVVGHGTSAFRTGDALRKRVGSTGVGITLIVVAVLPTFIGVGHTFLKSQICNFGIIALSWTVLTGWSGQVSLGQFGFVAVGADIASHVLRPPLIVLCPGRGGRLVSVCRADRPVSAASIWPSVPWASPCS